MGVQFDRQVFNLYGWYQIANSWPRRLKLSPKFGLKEHSVLESKKGIFS